MKFEFWNSGICPIGVDIGAWGVKLMQLRQGKAGLQAIASVKQPYPKPLPEDLKAQHAIVAGTLKRALSSASFSGRDCVSCLPPADVLLRAIRFPKMSDAELDQAVKWEAAERFGQPADDLEVQWLRAGEVVQGEEVRDEVILVATPRAVVTAHLDTLMECGLNPVAVDVDFSAAARMLTRTLRRDSDQETVRMILDVGAGGSSVTITRGQDVVFLKAIDIGGHDLNQAVADALSMDYAAAAQFRIERMVDHDDDGPAEAPTERVDRAAFDAVRPLIQDIVEEVGLCLRYYSVTFRGIRPEIVLITGGEALEPQLASLLRNEVKLPTSIARPLDHIDVSSVDLGGERRETSGGVWAVAAGLSLRGTAMAKETEKTGSRFSMSTDSDTKRGAA